MLADGALRQIDAISRFENRGNLSGRASRHFHSQLASCLQQLRVPTHRAEIGAWWRTQSVQTLLAVRADPAIERDARIGPLAAIWMGVGLGGQLAHQVATFSWSKARVRRGGDHGIAEQGDGFAWIGAYEHL